MPSLLGCRSPRTPASLCSVLLTVPWWEPWHAELHTRPHRDEPSSRCRCCKTTALCLAPRHMLNLPPVDSVRHTPMLLCLAGTTLVLLWALHLTWQSSSLTLPSPGHEQDPGCVGMARGGLSSAGQSGDSRPLAGGKPGDPSQHLCCVFRAIALLQDLGWGEPTRRAGSLLGPWSGCDGSSLLSLAGPSSVPLGVQGLWGQAHIHTSSALGLDLGKWGSRSGHSPGARDLAGHSLGSPCHLAWGDSPGCCP